MLGGNSDVERTPTSWLSTTDDFAGDDSTGRGGAATACTDVKRHEHVDEGACEISARLPYLNCKLPLRRSAQSRTPGLLLIYNDVLKAALGSEARCRGASTRGADGPLICCVHE
jgi:hypothetical protein